MLRNRMDYKEFKDRFNIRLNEYENRLRFRTINSLCEYMLTKYCQVRTIANGLASIHETDNAYEVGARVYHDLLGNGQITDIDGEIVTLRFDSSGIKKLSIKICKQKNLLKFI